LKFCKYPWDWHEQNFRPRSMRVKKVPAAAGWRENFHGKFVYFRNLKWFQEIFML